MKTKYFIVIFFVSCCADVFAQEDTAFRIDQIFESFETSNGPGLVVGVVSESHLIYSKSYGLSNLERKIPNSDSTIFSVASMAKQFTASCIYFLRKEGKIQLGDKVRKYLPELPVLYDDVTIQHMLNQTSGMREYHALMDMAGFDYNTQYYDNQTVLDLMCRQQKLNHAPGTKVVYGNSAYTLLAIIVERITDMDFGYYARTRIFDPLGMSQTFFRTTDAVNKKNKASGYVRNDDDTYSAVSGIQRSYGAGSLGSSLKDLIRWSEVINGLNPEYLPLREFLTSQVELAPFVISEYANGLMVDEYKGYSTVHHSGLASGFRSNMISIPAMKLSVIILANNDRINPTSLCYQVLNLLVPDTKGPGEEITMSLTDIKGLVGYYRENGSDMEMEITFENDSLRSRGSQSKQSIALVPSANWEFRRANSLNVRYEFPNDEADLIIYFGATPFYFSRVSKEMPAKTKMKKYAGNYFSKEVDCTYHFVAEKGVLYVQVPGKEKQLLYQLGTDLFGNGQRCLYRFLRDKLGKVYALEVSYEGNVMDIRFERD
jgi:CubicO group peptidase (beta-lactamase class C family)